MRHFSHHLACVWNLGRQVATNIVVEKCSMSDGPIDVFHILGSQC